MITTILARFGEKVTGRKVTGRISSTTMLDIQAQQKWSYDQDAFDRDWNWWSSWLPCCTRPQNFQCYSAKIDDELHGLMALDLRGRKIGRARALIVDYLATNPRDRIEGQGFKYIGVALMAVAVVRSLEMGMEGCIWLESLPDPKTLNFYENLGMTKQLGTSSAGYPIFVFEMARAKEFLSTATHEQWIEITNKK